MKIIRNYAFILFVFIFIGTFLHAQVEMIEQFRGGVPDSINKVVCPFILTRSHVIELPVYINDSNEKLTFVFDTGGITIIDKDLAKQLELKVDSMQTPDQMIYTSRTKEINCDGLKVKDFNMSVMDFKKIFDIGNDELEGMIGPDFVRFFRTTIDYQNNQLVFENNDTPLTAETPKQHLLEMEIMMPYHPSVQMKISDYFPIMGTIDTGLHYPIVLPVAFIEQLPEEEQGKLIACKGYFAKWPFVDTHENYLYKCDEISIGDMTLKDVGIIFANFPFNNSALLGKDFLEQFVTTLDFPNRKVLMAETEKSTKDILFSAGINVRKCDDDNFKIVGMWVNSPADKAGIDLEDIILEVNGNNATDIDTGELYLMRFDIDIKELLL
ncbi:aspartyl protease family protein, partial [bacterium]|nr:aspartyl protease family protein [bacterium]